MLVDPLQHVVRQHRELLVDRAERAWVLREEDVGGRVVAFLGDRRRELGAVAVADLDLGARLLLEAVEERRDDLLLAAGVDDELVLVPAAAATRMSAGITVSAASRTTSFLIRFSPCQVCLIERVRQTLPSQEKTVTREACGRTCTREPSGTISFDGRCETSSTPSRSTR